MTVDSLEDHGASSLENKSPLRRVRTKLRLEVVADRLTIVFSSPLYRARESGQTLKKKCLYRRLADSGRPPC